MTGGVLEGRTAIVTGAGGGIGRCHALAFAAAGANVVVNDIGVDLDGSGGSSGPADAVVAEVGAAGGSAISNTDSVTDYRCAADIVAAALDAFGGVDIVLNNASTFRDGPFTQMTAEDFASDVAVHLTGTFNLCHHAIPHMQRRGRGRIINTTSSSWHAGSGLAGYAAVKAGVLGLSFDLAAEFWRDGITANVLAPVAQTAHRSVQGQVWLEKLRAAGLMEAFLAAIPQEHPRAARDDPEDISPMAVFLASDAAASISGKVFEVMGNTVGVFAHPEIAERWSKDADAGRWTQADLESALREFGASARARAPHVR